MTSSPAQEFRRLLAAAATTSRSDQPLRLLAQRRAPLTSQGELRGHLDALLRLSCHGDGHGSGVLVFDWPTSARGHSVVRRLEDWQDGGKGLQVERREEEAGTVHLKVHFDAAAIPDAMLPLLELAGRVDLIAPLREEIARQPKAAAGHNGVHAPTPMPAPAPKLAPAEQEKVDRIVNHADYDAAQHPHVDPNGEVTNSNGEVFRLVMRRAGGGLRRQWMRVGKELAHN